MLNHQENMYFVWC